MKTLQLQDYSNFQIKHNFNEQQINRIKKQYLPPITKFAGCCSGYVTKNMLQRCYFTDLICKFFRLKPDKIVSNCHDESKFIQKFDIQKICKCLNSKRFFLIVMKSKVYNWIQRISINIEKNQFYHEIERLYNDLYQIESKKETDQLNRLIKY